MQTALSSVHTSNNVPATLSNATNWTILSTMSNVASTLFPFWQQCCRFQQQCRTKFRSTLLPTLLKGWHFAIESFDIVAVCGNKIECCFDKVERSFYNVACFFDVVAGVDGALVLAIQEPWIVDSRFWGHTQQNCTALASRRPSPGHLDLYIFAYLVMLSHVGQVRNNTVHRTKSRL